MWRQHLFSKRINDGHGNRDGFHFLTITEANDSRYVFRVVEREKQYQESRVAFIQDCGDKLYIGTDGIVSSVLREDHPHAYEQILTRQGFKKGRAITFVHGYFLPKLIPMQDIIPDLEDLLARQPSDLQEILSCANSDEERERADIDAVGIEAEEVQFSRPKREKNTDWDRTAAAFERGELLTKGMTFTLDGKEFHPLMPTKDEQEESASLATGDVREDDATMLKLGEWIGVRGFLPGIFNKAKKVVEKGGNLLKDVVRPEWRI